MKFTCACVPCDVDDPVTTLSEGDVRAAKEHVCIECRKPIVKGQVHRVETTLFEGKITRYRTCLDCYSLRKVFFCEGFYYHGLLEMLQEHVRECDGNVICDGVSQLTPGAKDRLFKMIEEEWARWAEDDE